MTVQNQFRNEKTKNIMKTKTEHELLQNFADTLGLTVHVYRHEDKRRNNQFCVYKGGTSVSGLMDYNECNHFFLGWFAAKNK